MRERGTQRAERIALICRSLRRTSILQLRRLEVGTESSNFPCCFKDKWQCWLPAVVDAFKYPLKISEWNWTR